MNFDLSAASEKLKGNGGKIYQKPGIYDDVKITSISIGSNSNSKKYIQMMTEGANGEIGRTPQMYLTDAAWPVSARNITDLIMATHNVSEEEAKGMIKGVDETTLVNKLTAILIGRKFRAKFKGEQSSTGTIFAQVGGSESMKVARENTALFYNEAKDIKMYEGTIQPKQATMTEQPSSEKATSDLPF